MSEQSFASDNSTRFPFALSWHSASMLLLSLEQAVEDLVTETDAEYRALLVKTYTAEATHLAAWIRQHGGYDCEDRFAALADRLHSEA